MDSLEGAHALRSGRLVGTHSSQDVRAPAKLPKETCHDPSKDVRVTTSPTTVIDSPSLTSSPEPSKVSVSSLLSIPSLAGELGRLKAGDVRHRMKTLRRLADEATLNSSWQETPPCRVGGKLYRLVTERAQLPDGTLLEVVTEELEPVTYTV